MDTIEKLYSLISEEMNVSPEELERDTTWEELGADSVDLVEMLMAIENAFDLTISDSDAQKLRCLGDVEEYIEENAKN
ncbi:MAG: acyl carrier protein [Oscillospiraceae bacterium]|nr:acyl carrier protein [Oscillospiraceae bacterium]MDD6146794.1 acyl carrier protein [Oscillospiraceae bacterium]